MIKDGNIIDLYRKNEQLDAIYAPRFAKLAYIKNFSGEMIFKAY
jgi:hypothetical protein